MKIAVIGKGGREQALVETLAASPCKPELYTYPGSDAIRQTAQAIPTGSFDELISWMVDHHIDLCVAGEESYLVKEDGLANRCARAGIPLVLPEKKYCTDNAAMIAAEGLMQYRAGNFADLTVNACAHIPLGKKGKQ